MADKTLNKVEDPNLSGKYATLISKSKDELDAEALELNVEEGKQNIDGDILATKRQIAAVKLKLKNAKSSIPLVPTDVVKIKQELEGYENGLKVLEELKEELF